MRFNGNIYDVSQHAWVPDALADIRANRACALVVNAKSIKEIASHVKTVPEAVRALPFLNNLIQKITDSLGPASPMIDPTALVGFFAVLGALGGMEGAIAVVTAAAHSHGSDIRVVFDIPDDLLNPADYIFSVEIFPPPKS